MVVSTFCKKCGVHLTIDRRKVTASTVTRSGVGMPDPWGEQREKKMDSPAPPVAEKAADPKAATSDDPILQELHKPVSDDEAVEGGFGVFLKQQLNGEASSPTKDEASSGVTEPPTSLEEAETPMQPDARAADEKEPEKLGSQLRKPHSNSPPPTPSPPPMNEGTLQKMRDAGLYRNHYFKDADCFECGHTFKVSRSLRSVACAQCGATIPMEDVEINMPSDQAIKTRGDVVIRKRGHVASSAGIRCKDLRCFGTFEADVQADGDVIFRSSGSVSGKITCRRLIIEKGSEVHLQGAVHAAEIEVHAKVAGTLFSSGPLIIGAYGSVDGDVTARSVSIEPGGELNGGMSIVTSAMAAKPAKLE